MNKPACEALSTERRAIEAIVSAQGNRTQRTAAFLRALEDESQTEKENPSVAR